MAQDWKESCRPGVIDDQQCKPLGALPGLMTSFLDQSRLVWHTPHPLRSEDTHMTDGERLLICYGLNSVENNDQCRQALPAPAN